MNYLHSAPTESQEPLAAQAQPAAGSESSSYRIKLSIFEGPMDLLLHLIRVNKLDIQNIPIIQITRQYLEYLDFMKELNLEIAGEFILIASTLIFIKSQILLPKPVIEEEEGEDPRLQLVERLKLYEQFKEASETLAEQWSDSQLMWRKGNAYGVEVTPEEIEFKVSLYDLIAAFKSILKRKDEDQVCEIMTLQYTVKDKIEEILARLQKDRHIHLSSLFEFCRDKVEMIIVFLALLELIKLREVVARQIYPQGPIWIRKRKSPAQSTPEPVAPLQ